MKDNSTSENPEYPEYHISNVIGYLFSIHFHYQNREKTKQNKKMTALRETHLHKQYPKNNRIIMYFLGFLFL